MKGISLRITFILAITILGCEQKDEKTFKLDLKIKTSVVAEKIDSVDFIRTNPINVTTFIKDIGKGSNTIYSLLVKSEDTNVFDAVNWVRLYFQPKGKFKLGESYDLSNDSKFETSVLYSDPWIGWSGIVQLENLKGTVKISNYADDLTSFEFVGPTTAELNYAHDTRLVTLIQDTSINFK